MFRVGFLIFLTSITIVCPVSRMDLKSSRITGVQADYCMDIPTMWSGYLTADREKIVTSSQPLESLNFYFMPLDNSEPELFLSLNIYSKHRYKLEPNHRRLIETNDYIFTVYISDGGSLSNTTDIAIFNKMQETASDDQYLVSLIRLTKNDQKLFDKTIWVNGKQLNTKAITDSNVTYLPIREVCEALGYRVGWLPDSQGISLARDKTYEVLIKNDINVNNGFSVVVNNNKAYISSLYFLSVLKLNVEIDERKNVILTES